MGAENVQVYRFKLETINDVFGILIMVRNASAFTNRFATCVIRRWLTPLQRLSPLWSESCVLPQVSGTA
jgi:hypothetical protein